MAESRMEPEGIKAFEARKDHKSRIYAFEQDLVELPGNYEKIFKKHKDAWIFFQHQPPWYRKNIIWWVISAKQEATRESRLGKLIEACAQSLRLR